MLPRAMQLAFLMAGHERLGAEACGSIHSRTSHGVCDVLHLILAQFRLSRGIVRAGTLPSGGCVFLGLGALRDPRAVGIAPASNGDDARLFVVDAWLDSILVFEGVQLCSAFCVSKADLQVGDNCCSRTLVEDIRLGNIKGPGADEVALGLAFTSHGHLVIAMGLRDATSLAPAVRGTHNLGPRGKLLLLDRHGIFLGFIDDAVWFTPPFSVVCDYADRIILQHRDGLAVYELHAAGSPLYPRLLPGSPRLVHFARPPLRELEQIKDEARCREQGGDECVEGGQVFTPAEASSILQLSGPCGVACDHAGHLLILDWER